jgi:DNA mismatch repair protein MutL
MNQSLTTIDTDTSIVRISGFIGKPENARRTPGEQFFFINGRFMKHPYFNKAILSAYERILPADTLPSYFIYMEADPDTIDINIHPTKTEIKFENEPAIFQILLAATRESLGKSNIFPTIDFDSEKAMEFPVSRRSDPIRAPEISYNPNYNPFDEELKFRTDNRNDNLAHWDTLFPSDPMKGTPPVYPEVPDQQQISFGQQNHTDTFVQLKNRFILTPVKSGLMVIDQHRAHERILYERFIRSLAMNYPMAQHTLFPETVELDHADYLILLEIMDDLHTIGFDIRDFGNNSIVVGGYPVDNAGSARDLIETFLDAYKNTESDLKTGVRERIARSLATAGAVKTGEVLSPMAMQDLVDNLFACESPGYSPSGKLVISIIGIEELDRRFK